MSQEEERLYKENVSDEENPYQSMSINDSEKIINTSQIEQWLILSNVICYVLYNDSTGLPKKPSFGNHSILDTKLMIH